MTPTRSPIAIASTWSWVTQTVVTPRRRWIRQMAARVSLRNLVSRFDIGSSNSSSRGARMMARPRADRWRWPPDNCAGRRSSTSATWSSSATSRTLVAAVVAWIRAALRANPMFSATVMCGYRAYDWNAIATFAIARPDVVHHDAVDADLATRDLLEPGDQPQHRALAASRRARRARRARRRRSSGRGRARPARRWGTSSSGAAAPGVDIGSSRATADAGPVRPLLSREREVGARSRRRGWRRWPGASAGGSPEPGRRGAGHDHVPWRQP